MIKVLFFANFREQLGTDSEQIEGVDDYPEHVKKLLLRMRRIKADKLVKGLI